jgi:hypothetical protein
MFFISGEMSALQCGAFFLFHPEVQRERVPPRYQMATNYFAAYHLLTAMGCLENEALYAPAPPLHKNLS